MVFPLTIFMSKILRRVVAFLYFLSHECETGTWTKIVIENIANSRFRSSTVESTLCLLIDLCQCLMILTGMVSMNHLPVALRFPEWIQCIITKFVYLLFAIDLITRQRSRNHITACVYSPAFDLVIPWLYINESFVLLQEQIDYRNAKGFVVVWETNGWFSE